MADIVGLRRACGAWKVLGFLLCGHISQETHTKMRPPPPHRHPILIRLYLTLLQRRRQFYPSYATVEVSSIAQAIVNDTSWFEGSVASYSSWVEVLIGGCHMWGNIGDLLHKFTMHLRFWLSKTCHTICANSSKTSGNNGNLTLQNVNIYNNNI
jgi:hypothetical protein